MFANCEQCLSRLGVVSQALNGKEEALTGQSLLG